MALESAFVSANALLGASKLTLRRKLAVLNWPLALLLAMIVSAGTAMLYSAAGGWTPWAAPHLIRFFVGVAIMIAVALVDIRNWMRLAYPDCGVNCGVRS